MCNFTLAKKTSAESSSNSSHAETLMHQWGLNESTVKVQGSIRNVLSALTSAAQRRLMKAKSLQVIAVPSADRAVWAYFPVYGRRRIAHKVRHVLRPTTRVLLVMSEMHFEEPWRETSESKLRHHLGHVFLYLRKPSARNECREATNEWVRNCSG